MLLLDELIKNPKKYNDLINSQNASINKNINTAPLLAMSMAYSTLALNIKNFYAIEKSNRLNFLKKCLYANRYSFGILLKKGRESYEKELKADGFKPNETSAQTEIEHIYLFLNDTDNNFSIQTINTIVSRGLIHVFDMITEEDFRHVVHNELLIDYDIELNYAAIKDDMQKAFLEFNFDLDSKRTAQYLRYFHCATPIEDIDYQCFYKPFFMALQDYSNYLQTKNNDISEEDNAVDFFEAREEDFREGYNGRLSYEDVKAIKEFKYMEELLYEDGIIDTDYNFIEKRGNKKDLAIIIKFMVYEKYFRNSNYKHPQNFEFYHYRQYLEHRYGVELAENMKKITDKDVKLHFLTKKWKYNLSRLVITDFFSLHTL